MPRKRIRKERNMITQKLYAIRDNKVNSYSPPMIYRNDVDATRNLEQALKNPQSQVSLYPADYDLYQIGTYEEETSRLKSLAQPKFIVACSSLKLNDEKDGKK